MGKKSIAIDLKRQEGRELLFDHHRVCWGQYRTVSDLIAHDERVSMTNPICETLSTPWAGTHRTAEYERFSTQPEPLRGQHTHEIIAEILGMNATQLGRIHDAGIVVSASGDPAISS